MVRLLVDRYADGPRRGLRGIAEGRGAGRLSRDRRLPSALQGPHRRYGRSLPALAGERGTVGLLLLRSYLLAGNAGHYDGVIAALEASGLRVIPAFASGLDPRPAIERFFMKDGRSIVDAVVSLTGFSLVGGPAYNDARAAEDILAKLDVPYLVGASRRIPDARAVGRLGSRSDAGREHHHGGDPRARRRDRADGLRRPLRRRRRSLHRLRTRLHLRIGRDRRRHAVCSERADMLAARTAQLVATAPFGARGSQGRDRAVQLPAERRQHRHRGVSRRCSNRCIARCCAMKRDRLSGRRARERRRAARAHRRRQRRPLRRRCQRPRPHSGRRPRPPREMVAGDRGAMGPGARASSRATAARSSCSASASATSSSASSRPSATKAIRCGCCSRRALRRRMPSRPSTAGCARISAPTRCCISARTARSNSCRASRPACPAPAGPTA